MESGECTAYLIIIWRFSYGISLLVNSCKCTVQLTEHTGREISFPVFSIAIIIAIMKIKNKINNNNKKNNRKNV